MFANFSISELRDKFQQLTVREQLLVLLVVGAAIYLLMDALVFSPQNQRQQEMQNNLKTMQAQVMALSAELAVVERTRTDELEKKEYEYQLLKQKVAQLDAVVGNVVPEAPKLSKLVGEVLGATTSKVKAVGIKTEAVKPLFSIQQRTTSTSGKAANVAVPQVYRHGLDIELRGSYLDLLSYLNKLEDANAKLFWSNATFSAGTYPENTLRASVFMLSAQPNP